MHLGLLTEVMQTFVNNEDCRPSHMGRMGGAPLGLSIPLSLGKGEGETEPVLSLSKEGEGL